MVEHVFSHGHILLSHIHNCVLAQTTRVLLCLDIWSLLGLVKDLDVNAVAVLPDGPEGDEKSDYEVDIEEGWDAIITG